MFGIKFFRVSHFLEYYAHIRNKIFCLFGCFLSVISNFFNIKFLSERIDRFEVGYFAMLYVDSNSLQDYFIYFDDILIKKCDMYSFVMSLTVQ